MHRNPTSEKGQVVRYAEGMLGQHCVVKDWYPCAHQEQVYECSVRVDELGVSVAHAQHLFQLVGR